MSRTDNKFDKFINELEYDSFMNKHYRIDTIIDYLNAIDKYLKEKTVEINDKIDKWQKSQKELEYSAIDFYIDDYTDFNSNFRKLKLKSSFISAYSLFEHHLKRITSTYMKYYDVKITVDDLAGNNYISKSKKYLEKVIELDLSSTKQMWAEITKYQKVRNKIVHNNSKFDEVSNELKKELSKLQGIEIDNYGNITLTDKQFIINFLTLFYDYTNEIIEVTRKKDRTD